jgi:hypothetical protein
MREAQTRASGSLPGTFVQRLAAIAHGDGICTTHAAAAPLVHIRTPTISTAAGTTATESGGICA